MSELKPQPSDINAEIGVIASILNEPELMTEATRLRLTSLSFFHPRHQTVFAAMEELFTKGIPINAISISEVLDAKGCLLDVGGFGGINSFSMQIDTSAGFTAWVRTVKNLDLKRRLIFNAKAIEEDVFNSPDEVPALIDKSLDRLFAVQQLLNPDDAVGVATSIDWDEVVPDQQVIPTSLPQLNQYLRGGYRPTELNLLAARPGMGKTTLAIQIALEALKRGRKVVFVSLEMSRLDIRDKMVSSLAGRNTDWVREQLQDKTAEVKKYTAWLKKASFDFMMTTGRNVHQFSSSIQKKHRQTPIDLLVIDYLQLMPTTNKGSRNDQVAEISRTLKVMAMELGISILALSQLSREGDKAGREPIPSDLRDSGSLEQDANSILFIHKKDDESFILKLAKNRMGTCGVFKVNADFCNNRFLEIDSRAQEPAGYVKPQAQAQPKPQPVLPYHLQREEKPAF
jgi:replicative DNA helicase